MSFRRILLAVHRYLGMLAALPLVLLAFTGSILVFEAEIDRGLNPTYWTVHPQGQPLPFQELIRDARIAYPRDPVTSLRMPTSPDVAAEFGLKGGLSISADPYTGRILGARRRNQLLITRIHQFHTRLLIGVWGERIMGTTAICLLLLSISGMILWWRRKTFGIQWSMPWRRLNYDAHYAIGLYGMLPWLIFGITGAAIAFESFVRPALNRITHSSPADPPALRSVPIAGTTPLTVDAALTTAAGVLPGAQTTMIGLPQNRTDAFVCFMKFPEDHTPAGRSRVALDQYTGHVIWLENSRATATATRIWNKNRPIHTGDIFGWPTRLLACLASLALGIQVFSGVWLWAARKLFVTRRQVAEVAVERDMQRS